ncbi:hypothetical protein MTO98_08530 [Mucilaginibacter sp. SMC90]|uniref:hypothetical protein n=1 Tax=Mucilaginibacter sp. SMC90 TaxID=2929803 RepID=UPI001FB328EB|nr:hypothetical protein [Mucilaginibacter sp. SMC90]UOE51119.1 hypothetical protein MTO98_08530 [Mucilaginibacter sp. SMC90]
METPTISEFIENCDLMPNISLINIQLNKFKSIVIFQGYADGLLFFSFIKDINQISVSAKDIKSIESVKGVWQRQ